jgi:nitrite reductase/ring-hydroxylating ferredoxin subunit
MTTPRPSRRIVFQGLGALGVAAILAGCGGDDSTSDDSVPTAAGSTPTGSTPTDANSDSGSGTESSGGKPSLEAGALATTAEIPVGGGIVLTDVHIVITQPTAGEFAAFGSRCKHQGFDVGRIEGGTITCLHHGSQYDAATGDVTRGPAPTGLDKVAIDVRNGQIFQA